MGPIAAVVLAAGTSSRFGADNKLLASLDDRPIIRRVVEAVIGGGVGDVVVVTGNERPRIELALDGLAVRLAFNPRWELGMGTSIAAGVTTLDPTCEGFFVIPGDMPLLTAQLIAELINAFARAGRDRIVYPTTADGDQRNPVLWPKRFLPALSALAGGEGGKAILAQAHDACLPLSIGDVEALQDIDTPADLAGARAILRRNA